MPHPEQEHALMIEVATLTRQRDDMERIGNAKIAKWQSRAEKAESERDALRAENGRLREVVQAAIGTHGDPCSEGERCQFMRDARAALASGGDRE